MHPLGAAPVITDGNAILAESGANVDYIIARHGQGRFAVKADAANYPDYIFWFHYVTGTLQPSGSLNMILDRAGLPAGGHFCKPCRPASAGREQDGAR